MRMLDGKPFPLGVTVGSRIVNFAVDAGEDMACSLLLYRRGGAFAAELPMAKAPMAQSVHCLSLLASEIRGCEYNYKIDGVVTPDPFAIGLCGKKGWLSQEDPGEGAVRCRIRNASFDWEDDLLPRIPDCEVIAYSLHLRGYTKNRLSGVKKKGTFAGLMEKIPYFKALGVNQIQCMPICEFDEWQKPDPTYFPASGKEHWKVNYWGYGSGKFMAPKRGFSSTSDAAKELKTLVRALHKEGIELVVQFPFDGKILPQDMIHVLRYWHMEYHVDGFLINPYVLPLRMAAKDPVLRCCKIYVQDEEFQIAARRFLKGDEGAAKDAKRLFSRIAGHNACNTVTTPSGFTLADLVSYENKHNEANGENNRDGNNYNLSWNCGVEGPTQKEDVLKLRRNQARNAMAMLLLSQGTPCILGGDEFLNSQKGNNNVYCQDNPTGWTDWNRAKKNGEMIGCVRDLIAFRKRHPALRSSRSLTGNDTLRFGLPDISYHGEAAWRWDDDAANRQLGILLCGGYMHDDDIYLAYNMHWNEHAFALPALGKKKKWYRVFTTESGFFAEPECLDRAKEALVKERTVEIFVGR